MGFAQTFLFEKKSDGQLSTGDTVYVLVLLPNLAANKVDRSIREIFEVAFPPGQESDSKRKRMITKAFAAFGEMTPLSASGTAGRKSKAKGRPKNISRHSTVKTRSSAPKGITKMYTPIRNRK